MCCAIERFLSTWTISSSTGQYKFTPLSKAEERKFYDGSQSRINKSPHLRWGLN